MEPDTGPRGPVPPQQLVLLGGVLVTLALGFVGWTELQPALPWDERLFKAINLLGLSYDAPPESVVPLSLNAARFLAHAVAFYAFGSVVNSIFHERGVLFRASLSRRHIVIVGDAPEVPQLALNFRLGSRETRTQVVVVSDLPAESAALLGRRGVLAVPMVPLQSLRRVVKDAAAVVVAGSSDRETARLAGRVEQAAGDAGIPTTVVFDGRDLTHEWNQTRPGSAVCRSTQVAIATLRLAPPRPADRVSPPPIVIGQGIIASEIARRMVIGWQELGERMPVHCLGPDRDWVDDIEVGLADRAELRFVRTALNRDSILRSVDLLTTGWTPPPPTKARASGPTIVIAVDDETRAFTLAVALSQSHPDARVAALVEDAAVWEPRLASLAMAPILVSRDAQLSDPNVLAITAEQLMTEELLNDAGRWPPEIPTVFGSIRHRADGTPPLLADQAPATRRALLRIAAEAEEILAAGGVSVRGGEVLDDRAIILSPDELRGMADRLGALVEEPAPDLRLRTLELAARLPTIAARAGWAPHRPPGQANLLSQREIVELAPRVHARYQDLSARAGNATGSEVPALTWDDLTLFEQESNRAQIAHAPVKLAALSLSWRRSKQPTLYRFSPEQVEFLAELEHRRWEHHQRRNGRPAHIWAKPWDELDDAVKEYDREPVRALAETLAAVGIEIVDRAPSVPHADPSAPFE